MVTFTKLVKPRRKAAQADAPHKETADVLFKVIIKTFTRRSPGLFHNS